jgi:hypothetical protein
MLDGGKTIEADFLVVGTGVRPRTQIAESADLALDRRILVNARLETSARGVYAAGDVARFPDRQSGDNIRVEHWGHAGRQSAESGHALGSAMRTRAVPSTTRAAILIRCSLSVANSARNRSERFGTALRTGSMSQAPACRIRRNVVNRRPQSPFEIVSQIAPGQVLVHSNSPQKTEESTRTDAPKGAFRELAARSTRDQPKTRSWKQMTRC